MGYDYSMMKNHGLANVPLVLGLVVLIATSLTLWWLTGGEALPTPESNQTETLQKTAPKKSRLIWEAGLSGALLQALQPNAHYEEALGIDGNTTIKVVSDSAALTPTIIPAPGTNPNDFTITKTVIADPDTGRVATFFQINPNGTSSGNFEIVVTNNSNDTSSNFAVNVSTDEDIESTPGSNDSEEDDNGGSEETISGGNATLTITIQETIGLNVTIPITGASVIAIITSPSGQVFTVNLIEVSPGVYTGIFSNITEPGTYLVTYVISGQDSDGDHFDQTVDDSFDVDESDLTGSDDDDPAYQSTKVFDINQGGEIRPKQTGEY